MVGGKTFNRKRFQFKCFPFNPLSGAILEQFFSREGNILILLEFRTKTNFRTVEL